jgi:hypothetical protein
MDTTDIKNRFTFHPVTGVDQGKRYESVRAHALDFALWLDEAVPDSREKSLAITHLEEVVFWANASIARH